MSERGWFARVPRHITAYVLALISLFATRPAAACACCDSLGYVDALGWSTNGTSLLLRHEDQRGCERKVALEVHDVGSRAPSACYDRLTDTAARRPCDNLTSDRDRPESKALPPGFDGALRSVDPSHIHFTFTPFQHKEGYRAERATLRVTGITEPLAQLEFKIFTHPLPHDDDLLNQPQVAILEVPSNKGTAILIRGYDVSPGLGHRGWSLRWAPPLPATVPLVHGARFALALRDHAALDDADKPKSQRENGKALKLHHQGNYAAATDHFTAAVNADPEGAVLSRYNLACALARQGAADRAMLVLRELLTKPNAAAREERRTRAQRDDDLATLRHRPDFAELVCGGRCESPTATPVTTPSAAPRASAAPNATQTAAPATPPQPAPSKSNCSCRTVGTDGSRLDALSLLGITLVAVARRRRHSRELSTARYRR